MPTKPKYHYAALPLRALSDTRLTRTHLAVLGAISYHDRFRRNGSGCYASQMHIANIAACNAQTVSRRVRDLVKWGYLVAERQKNRRRLQYTVIHQTDANTCPTGQVSEPDTCPTGQVLSANTCPTGQTKRSCKTSNRHPDESASAKADAVKKYIPPVSGVPKDLGTLTWRSLTKLRQWAPSLSADSFRHADVGGMRAVAAQVDRAVRKGEATMADVQVMRAIADHVQGIYDMEDEGHVQRVLEDVEIFVTGGYDDMRETA